MAPAEAEDIVVVEVVAEVAINQSQKLPGDFVEVQNRRVVFFYGKMYALGSANETIRNVSQLATLSNSQMK